MAESLRDKLFYASSGIAKKKTNIANAVGGTLVEVLRITHSVANALPGKTYDAFGYSEKKLEQFHAETIPNVGLAFPTGMLEVFQKRMNNGETIKAITYDLIELLNIRMSIQNNIPNFALGDNPNIDAINIKRNDIIVWIIKDPLNHKIPVVMRVEKQYEGLMGKHMVYPEYELTLEMTNLEGEIQDKINAWVASLP